MRITPPQKLLTLHPHRRRPRQRLAIRHRPRRRTVPIHPIRPRTQNRNSSSQQFSARKPAQTRNSARRPHRQSPDCSLLPRQRSPRAAADSPSSIFPAAPANAPRPSPAANYPSPYPPCREILRLATMMRRVHQIMLAQQNFESRPRKRRIAILGSLAQFPPLDHRAQRNRQFPQQSIFPHNPLDIFHRGRVRHSRPGSQRGFLPVRHIADRKSNLHRPRRSRRQPPALGSRQMLAHHINFLDRRTACDQRGM